MDPLTTRLAEALRALAQRADDADCHHDETYRAGVQWTVCCACGGRWADDAGGVPEHAVHPALRRATEALAAYDERVACMASAPELAEALARLGALERRVEALAVPAPDSQFAANLEEDLQRDERKRRHLESVGLLGSRPSVGRWVRSLDSGNRYFPRGNEAVVIEYEGCFGIGKDGAEPASAAPASTLSLLTEGAGMPSQAHHRMWQRCHEIERAFSRLYIRERKERVWRGMESNIPPDMAECRNWCDAYDAATVPTPPNPPRTDTGD